jgi:peptidoglycan/LPS O-acetylase OafA/YrhL
LDRGGDVIATSGAFLTGLADREDQFRPDLEGLRAVAVLLVLLYHAHIPGFAGGYVGVDVFFVLSGFFITGVIDRELRRTGHFNVTAFYARRARRLLPAAAVVLLATLAASALILPSVTLRTVSVDIASAGAYVSNLRFGIEANDYFKATAFPSPVLHFWSLSLEEQFYLFWPAALFAARRVPLGRSAASRMGAAVVVIGVASLAAGVWLTGVNQPWAFYLLPTRAWELALGGLIALQFRELRALPRQAAALATPAGVCLILAANLVFDDSTSFPGTAALLPVVGSALVIVGGLPDGTSLSRRLLSAAPMRYLGRISYSLYLWHWPIIVLGSAIIGAGAAPLLAMLSIGVAGLSQRLVEEPMRHGRFIGTVARWNLVQVASIAVLIFVASFAVASFRSIPGPAVASVTQTGAATGDQGGTPEPCSGCTIGDLLPPLDALGDGFFPNCALTDISDPQKCVLGSPAAHEVIAIFGDSFAWHWMPAFDDVGSTRGIRVLNLVRGACPPGAVTVWSEELKRIDTECDQWREQALRRIEAEHPSVVVLASSNREILVTADGSLVNLDTSLDGPHSQRWISGLRSTLQRLASMGTRIVIVDQPPSFSKADLDPVPCIAAHPTDFQQACRAPRSSVIDAHARAVDRQAAAGVEATFVDPAEWLCDVQTCPAVVDRFVVYRDFSGHLTAPFALSRAARWAVALGLPGK